MASTSLAALLVGGSVPSAWAACATNITGSVTGCTNAGVITGINVHDATVSGTILNTGVIQSNGISVNTASTINGAIADTGTLFGGISVDHTSKVAATLTGIAAVGPTFGGGITNAGTVSAGTGILVGGLGNTFLGGVTNSGTLSAGGNGILVTGAAVFGAAGAGGITNSGTITGGNFNYGTLVQGVTAFNAAIDNSSGATITAGRGIGVSSVSVFGNSVSGGITNAGNITAKARTGAGIFATGVSTFIGNVSNSGTITANGASGIGIFLRQVATFQGAVSNSGTISAHFIGIGVSSATVFGSASAGGGITNSGVISVSNGTGISVQHVSTFYGNVSNSGTILAANTGIFICNCVTLAGGGVTNTGTISAFAGIVLNDHSAVSVFDSGTIVSTGGIGGTAVDLRNAGPGNTFTLGPGYNITGNVLGAGSDTFQLGGTGSGNFNLSNIGSSQQYQGFTTFNEVGSATWTVTGTFSPTNPWTVQSGTLIIEGSLGNASGVTLSGGTIVIGSNNALGSGTLSMAPGTTLSFLNTANFTVANPITISGDPFFTPPADTTQTISGAIGNGGSPGVLEMSGAGTLVLSGVNSYSGGTTISSGVLQVTNNNSVGTGTVTLSGGALQAGGAGLSFGNAFAINTTGGTIDTQANTLTLSGAIGNGNGSTGALTKIGSGTLILSGTSNYTGATNVNGGILQAGAANALAPASAFTIASGATLNLNNFNETIGSLAGAGSATLGTGALTLSNASGTFSGVISGIGGTLVQTAGTETLTGANTYTGGTALNGGTLIVGNNSALGTGTLAMAAGTTLSFLPNGNLTIANPITLSGDPTFTPPTGTTQTLSGVISDGGTRGTLEMSGAGTLVLSAANTYAGPTNVNSGALDVTGSIAASSLTTVAGGATLTGTGKVGNTQINAGGSFAPGSGTPGSSMTITGNLAFASGALYVVDLNPSVAEIAKVTGAATLTSATVSARFASGSYVPKQYTILTAAGGLGGTTFSGLTNTNLPAGLVDTLSYSASNVYLNLEPGFTQFTGLSTNQQSVVAALVNHFDASGGLPASFATLSAGELTQLSGEVAADSQIVAFQLMDEFLNLMLDPFVDGRLGSGVGGVSGRAMGFAPDEQATLPPDIALAYAGVLKAPPLTTFEQRWTAWGASYGGGNWTSSNAAIGSNNVSAQTYGFAGGLDYHYSPDTIFGFGLGGGGTAWGLAGGLGTGRSDAFQTGVYGITRSGPAYFAAALAFANHWMTTNRSAVGDGLTANFDAQSYGARVEGGYRFAALPALGVTPYAALQAQDFHTPSYSETNVVGGGFGLSYAAMNATDIRTELGTRFDNPEVIAGMPLLLRARLAWAHDFINDPSLGAVFESLPGTNFVVNGAPLPQNSALTSAGAELYITPRLTLLAKFDGEFAAGSLTYAGSGTLRYMW